MKTQAILAAGGQGTRLKADVPKPLILLDKKPLFVYALEIFEQCAQIETVIVVCPRQYIKQFKAQINKHGLKKVIRVVSGGPKRRDSVLNGLKNLDQDSRYVLIHDAARPFVRLSLVERAIQVCYKHNAVILAVQVKPTIKRVNAQEGFVEATLDRRFLWEAQTPQVFRKDIITAAHTQFRNHDVTDDAALVEKLGHPVKVIEGDYSNIKITTVEDMTLARHILETNKKSNKKRGNRAK